MVQMRNAASKWGSSGLAYLTGLPDGPPDFSRAERADPRRAGRRRGRAPHRCCRRRGHPADRAGRTARVDSGRPDVGRRWHPAAGGPRRLVCDHAVAPRRRRAVPALRAGDEAPADPWPLSAAMGRNTSRRPQIIERAAAARHPGGRPGRGRRVRRRRFAGWAPGRPRANRRPAGGRPVLDVGGPAVRAASGARRSHRRQGRKPPPPGWHPGRQSRILRLDERRKALLLPRFRSRRRRTARAAGGRRRRDRRFAARGAGPTPARTGSRGTATGPNLVAHQRIRCRTPGGLAFGDDAAVAGGLVGTGADGPVFCGDAIADPLTGLEAASAVAESLGRGGGELITCRWPRSPRTTRHCRPAGAVSEHPAPPARLPPVVPAGRRIGSRQRRRTPAGRRKTLPVMLIQRATLLDGTTTDIRVGARIEEVADGLTAGPGESVLDAGGGTVLPGLHDHHVHVRSAASALDSLLVGPPAVRTKDQLARHCRMPSRAPTDGSARSATTNRLPASWTAPPSTHCCPTFRCASSTAAGCLVDPQLRGVGPGRDGRTPRRPPAQHRSRLVRTRCSAAKPIWPN